MSIEFTRTNANATINALNALGSNVTKAKELLAKAKQTYRDRLITLAQPALKIKDGEKWPVKVRETFYTAFISERDAIYVKIDSIHNPQDEKTENQSLKKHFQRVLQDVKKELPILNKLVLNPSDKAKADRENKAAQRTPKVQPTKVADKKPAADVTPYDKRMTQSEVMQGLAGDLAGVYDQYMPHMPLAAYKALEQGIALTLKSVRDSWKAETAAKK